MNEIGIHYLHFNDEKMRFGRIKQHPDELKSKLRIADSLNH